MPFAKKETDKRGGMGHPSDTGVKDGKGTPAPALINLYNCCLISTSQIGEKMIKIFFLLIVTISGVGEFGNGVDGGGGGGAGGRRDGQGSRGHGGAAVGLLLMTWDGLGARGGLGGCWCFLGDDFIAVRRLGGPCRGGLLRSDGLRGLCCSLAQVGRLGEAVGHVQRAAHWTPF